MPDTRRGPTRRGSILPQQGALRTAYQFAAKGLRIAYPKDALFVEDMVYQYGLLDEFAVAAYWTGRYAECVEACDRLLTEGKLPVGDRDRVQKNKNLAIGKMQEIAGLSSPESGAFIKLLRAARQKEKLGCRNDEVISAYEEAIAACPTRAEALHGAARFCRIKGLYGEGYEFAAKGSAIAYPSDALAVEDWIYEYGLLDEFAVNAYWTARYEECVIACDRLLTEGKLPVGDRDRVQKNKNLAIGKMQEIAGLSSLSLEHSSSSFAQLGKKRNSGALMMRLSPPTRKRSRHVRHAPRAYTARLNSAATRGSTNKRTSSPGRVCASLTRKTHCS